MTRRDILLLTPLARFGDLGLLFLRLVTGAFLIYQSHDNILSAGRMDEFEEFLTQFGFPAVEVLAPLCVWAQFLCGIAFVLGFLTRWAGLVTVFVFDHGVDVFVVEVTVFKEKVTARFVVAVVVLEAAAYNF